VVVAAEAVDAMTTVAVVAKEVAAVKAKVTADVAVVAKKILKVIFEVVSGKGSEQLFFVLKFRST
jgi:hypothetical protein